MCTNEKVNQTFLQHPPVPVQQVVKSFKVVIIPVLYVEKTATCRFPVNLWWIQSFDAHLKRITNKFQVSIYSV